jgi:anti-sigma factor RsiW
MTDEPEDALLVAFIDNQLDEARRKALAARLVVEPELRARIERLAAGGLPFRRAFEVELAEAPLARMQERLDGLAGAENHSPARPARTRWIAAAAAALALLLIGWGIGRYAPIASAPTSVASDNDEDWRQAVAEYVSLYTPDTFAGGADAKASEAALALLSQKLGVALTPASVALPDLTLKRADMLAYDGAPLGQVAYLDSGGPVVFCIIRNGEKDEPISVEKREDVTLASWGRGGRGYLVAGRLSPERTAALAKTLSARF